MIFSLQQAKRKTIRGAMLCLFTMLSVIAFAQQRTITGLVRNGADKAPLSNISVQVERSSRGAITNEKGLFTLMASSGETITFSGVGFGTKQLLIDTETSLVVDLMQGEGVMESVVVTALGIKRNEKSLGYAVTKIDSAQLTDAPSGNWTDALSGKVAGLNLIRSGSGPAGSNKIILRGENNLTGDNEALIVLDGVVINNSSGRRSANATDNVYATNSDNLPADYGSSLNDINPQDIESVSVLKGPAAAALYGQRGANGAVIITTKSAKSNKKKPFNIRFTSNGSVESINRYPDLQYEYGQGTGGAIHYSFGAGPDGASTSGTSSAYGPRFNGQMFYQYDPVTQRQGKERTPWVPYDNINDFWDVGKNLTNSLSLDGKIGSTAIRLSLTNQDNKWIVPNTGFNRKSAYLSTNTDITSKLKFSTKINYGYRQSDNLPAAGYGNQSLMYWYIFWQPSADYNWLRNYWDINNVYKTIEYPFSTFPENPFAIVNEFLNKTRRNNLTGSAQFNYQLTKELSFMLRGNLDWSKDKREQDRPYDAGSRLPRASVRKQDIYARELSYDFLARYDKKISEDVKFGASLGGSQLKNIYNKIDVRADGLRIADSLTSSPYPALYNFDNNLFGLGYVPDTSRYQINSIYGIANFSFRDYLFVEFTGRQDWNSVLATPVRTDNVGFFYPSLNTSFVLSDFTKLPDYINYAKLRASVAQVGSGGTTPYRTAYTYLLARTSAGGLYPDSALANPRIMPNENLRPLKTTTFELGAEAQFFKNRFGFDIAVYWGNTKDQILTRTLDRASGYDYSIINAGKVKNTGIEISLNGKPIVRKDGFNWSLFATFASNRNRIASMPDSTVLLRAGAIASGQIVASIGGSMGDLYGLGYVRSPDGQVVFDPTTGFPKITDEIIYLGNTTPRYKASIGNTFSYKKLSLKLLFDGQAGAVGYSLTNYKMVEQGKLKSTLPGRYNGIIGNGVLEDGKGGYRKNDVVAIDIDQYYRYNMGDLNAEGSTFSTDFIKFREASLSYVFNPRLLKKIGLGSATIGVYGRDLFIWSPWPMFDPEFGTLSGSDIVTGFETGQFPSTRSFGFNLAIAL